MVEAKRTPGPLHLDEYGNIKAGVDRLPVHGAASPFSPGDRMEIAKANSAFIIRAWNSHDALVDAVDGLLQATGDGPRRDAAIVKARSILAALAKGEKP